MKLTDNTILITGGTSGIGLEWATRLLAMGNTVIVTGRDPVKLDQTKKRLPGIHTYQSDVRDPVAIRQLYEQVTTAFPRLNMLINNAGEMRKMSLHKVDFPDITREVEIDLMGPIRMVQQFLPHLERQPVAAILNASSGLALVPFPLTPIYSAAKAGLHSYTQSLRVQLQQTNVRVFELLAPASGTPLNDQLLNEEGFDASTLMAPDKIVDVAIRGLLRDKEEIYPGLAKLVKVLSRLAPKLALSQTSKIGIPTMMGKKMAF